MKLRHPAALALVGWYLMIPSKTHLDVPISERIQYAAYDSAKECQDALNRLMERVEAGDKRMTIDQLAASACIASDDPRLKRN